MMASVSGWSTLLFFIIVVFLPAALTTAKFVGKPFVIRGSVYCDTCRCGFETNKTTYIPGFLFFLFLLLFFPSSVDTMQLRYSDETTTDKDGAYEITVEDDHGDQICETVLVSSPWGYCKVPDPGRSHSQVIVTRSNGAISNLHFANAMGFLKDQAEDGCTELVRHLLFDDI
ncbi:Protein DOWNSTREAM OF FLC [Linum perenne]